MRMSRPTTWISSIALVREYLRRTPSPSAHFSRPLVSNHSSSIVESPGRLSSMRQLSDICPTRAQENSIGRLTNHQREIAHLMRFVKRFRAKTPRRRTQSKLANRDGTIEAPAMSTAIILNSATATQRPEVTPEISSCLRRYVVPADDFQAEAASASCWSPQRAGNRTLLKHLPQHCRSKSFARRTRA